jgi:RNA polymerase sigma factor (sigma-70 family)
MTDAVAGGGRGGCVVRDDPSVVALVARAKEGDPSAWDELVERYAPLVWSICRRHRLGGPEADDVGQSVWLRLVEQLDTLREPAALPGWLATTTRRECLRVTRVAGRRQTVERPLDVEPPGDDDVLIDQELIKAERRAALRVAFAQLPLACRRLLTLLMQEPPLPYAEISSRLGTPIGSIGPNRARCLARLRRSPALAVLRDTETEGAGGGRNA